MFPLAPGEKVPLLRGGGGFKGATTDADQIRAWWSRCPEANIGIRCSRFLVFDIDSYKDDGAEMRALVELHGKLPVTPTIRTGSGGYQYLFETPSFRLRFKPTTYTDIRNEGGYIVAPPSSTTLRYRWLRPPETPIAVMPAWLQALCKAPDPVPAIPVGPLEDIALERRIERARAYLERVEPAVSGQNGSARTLVAAQHVARGFALSLEQAFMAMADWNQRCDPPWSDRELKRKIEQALREGRTVQPGQHLARDATKGNTR